ncbi:hypothetical protein EMIHUDRAFT_243567 [Emiliania huxleyi CCMP1516]|uniref:U2A'/phosphoprotein 32 family A C-terminal domain-containing protein n=2 Tax=Emiliania huxleyi TaxID=2903 RepID=A0A0D3J595_EMIH1|nr:hypothetical protein EMIHUDRAFT_243567 [Emiliania huxleyi CCMP1516]EOD18680.1 hypothetical protein EMIHUDRAFT_243567 [Emiliania huxleyi CCMP1516]|eukprot:XP_005771109.1 hypothetical protein EMIHUDRAFT_243567 [Emiliania huxleyi CCMP1516]
MATSRLTGDAVKANTGQYDCADVHSLAMPRAGLRVIEALAPCVNLRHLDLSHNRIGRMEGLEALAQLRRLALSDNEITTIQGALLLDGNRITSVDDASCLEPLPKLRNLQLQRPTQHDSPPDASSNPCCKHPQYRVVLRRLLTMLDGESLALVDAAGLDASPSKDV